MKQNECLMINLIMKKMCINYTYLHTCEKSFFKKGLPKALAFDSPKRNKMNNYDTLSVNVFVTVSPELSLTTTFTL